MEEILKEKEMYQVTVENWNFDTHLLTFFEKGGNVTDPMQQLGYSTNTDFHEWDRNI